MVDLEDLCYAFVTRLRAIPTLVAALGGESRIFAYIDNNPDFNSLDNAAYAQEPGTIMCGWAESRINDNDLRNWSHQYKLYVRAPRRGVSALRLMTLLINGVPDPGDGQRWHYCPLMSGVYTTEIPASERFQDSEGIDYFAVTTETRETGDI